MTQPFSTRVFSPGTEVHLDFSYKHSRVKQYLKEGRALRIETVVNKPKDIGVLARLEHLPELISKARQVNDRLLRSRALITLTLSANLLLSRDGNEGIEEDLAGIFTSLWPHFNERDRRLVAAACAQAMGHGGVTTVSKTSGLSRPTVTKAISELHEEPLASGRVRKEGAGRRRAGEADPGLERALDALVDPESRGDPESPLRWTIKSTRQLASALADGGRPVAPNTVRSLLYRLGYSLQSNAKVAEGARRPDRNDRFGYINEQVRRTSPG